MLQLSKIISFLLHPIFLFVYLFIIAVAVDSYLQFVMPPEQGKPLLIILVINTIVLPVVSLLFLLKRGAIQSIYLTNPKDRKIGVLVMFVFYLITYILIRKLAVPQSFLAIFCGVLVSLVIVFFISGYFNISMHALAVGGLIGTLFGLFKAHAFINLYALAGAFILFGLSATSRLLLKAHTAREINFGALIGIILFYLIVGNNYYF